MGWEGAGGEGADVSPRARAESGGCSKGQEGGRAGRKGRPHRHSPLTLGKRAHSRPEGLPAVLGPHEP